MIKAQHTPGPWDIDSGADGAVISLRDTATVAIVPDTLSDWEANARLIAAAPEMLAMLKRIFKVMPSRMEEGGQLLEGEIAALIAKATGE